MAVNLYTGVMGAGKTHEAVKELVLVHSKPQRENGRPRGIVACISGLDVDAVSDRVAVDCKRFPTGVLDEDARAVLAREGASGLRVVDYDRVLEPHFFPTEEEVKAGNTAHCVVQPGDLVILDEAWRYYQPGQKISAEHMEFLRMHRHFAHPVTGTTCDIAILIQDLGTLDRKIKNVVEQVYKFKKHRTAGLNSRYLVQHFDGNSTRMANLVNTWQRKYDPAIFPLYKSHTTGNATEKNIDRRAVFWKDPKFIAVMVGALVVIVAGPILTLRTLWHMAGGGSKAKSDVVANPVRQGGSQSPATATTVTAPAVAAVKVKRPPIRVVGSVVDRRGVRWILVDAGDGVALMPEGAFQGNGVGLYGSYQGRQASTWGGGVPSTRDPVRAGSGVHL